MHKNQKRKMCTSKRVDNQSNLAFNAIHRLTTTLV
nr:MAG TPA: hypothetical protein [Caudoviricetes sp.]